MKQGEHHLFDDLEKNGNIESSQLKDEEFNW